MIRTVVSAALLAFVLAACGPPESEVAGTWAAVAEDGSVVSLELSADRRGVWTYQGAAAPLSWERRGDDAVWLHTKDGGVFTGWLEGDILVIQAPAVGRFEFRRQ